MNANQIPLELIESIYLEGGYVFHDVTNVRNLFGVIFWKYTPWGERMIDYGAPLERIIAFRLKGSI